MRSRSAARCWLGLLGLLVTGLPAAAQPIRPPTLPPQLPAIHEPREDRSEAAEDRLLSTAYFADGRLSYRREDFPAALQRYQRAFRYSDGVNTILNEIVTLAFRLGRHEEAVRYTKFIQTPTEIDPFVLRRLAMYLTDTERYAEALRLHELTLPDTAAWSDSGNLGTHFEIGRLGYLVGDYVKAAQHFEIVWQSLETTDAVPVEDRPVAEALRKESATTYSLIAETFLECGQLNQAKQAFQRAYPAPNPAPILAFHLARVASKNDQQRAALDHLTAHFASGVTDAGLAPYELLAELLERLPDQRSAASLVDRLEELRKRQPKNVFLAYYLGDYHLRNDNPERALVVFLELMKTQPLLDGYRAIIKAHYQQRQANDVVIRLVEAAATMGDLSQLNEVVALVGRDDSFWKQMVVWAEDWRNGKTDLGEGNAVSPQLVAQVLAETAAASERSPDANRFFRLAVEQEHPNRAVWMNWGLECLASNRVASAADVFRAMLDGDGKDQQDAGLVNYYLAAALALNDQFDEALAAAEEAGRRLPGVPAIQMRRAWVLYLAKRWQPAYDAYEEFIRAFNDDPQNGELILEAKSSLSALAMHLGRPELAEEWLEQILDEAPQDVGALNDLGYIWAERGVRLQRALAMIKRAVNAEPENVAYRDSLGWALFQLGRTDEAVDELKVAAAGDDPDGVILDHLGDALLVTEGRDAASAQWRRALQQLADTDVKRSREIQLKLSGTSSQNVE